MLTSLDSRYDVVIVGARVAGAATAMLLARHGLRVLAVDRGQYGADTLSTHALMRGGVLQLHKWGVLDAVNAAGAVPIRQTTFYYGDDLLTIPIKPRDGIEALYAPRRALLDRLLVDYAVASGAHVRHGIQVDRLLQSGDGRVAGVAIRDKSGEARAIAAGIVIGADGLRSTVARFVGARAYVTGRYSSGGRLRSLGGRAAGGLPLVLQARHQRRSHSHQLERNVHLYSGPIEQVLRCVSREHRSRAPALASGGLAGIG